MAVSKKPAVLQPTANDNHMKIQMIYITVEFISNKEKYHISGFYSRKRAYRKNITVLF